MTNVDQDLWLPALFMNLAIGRALVEKGVLSKEEVLRELRMIEKGNGNPEIEKAVRDAMTSVSKW